MAFVLRLITSLQLAALPIVRSPHMDSDEYLVWAQQLAGGDFTWPRFPAHAPGYPYFLGAILSIGSLVTAHIVQAIVGAITCLLVALATRRLFGERAGVAAGMLLAIYAPLIWIDGLLLAEGLLICLMAATLWSAATERPAIVTGVLLGLAALVRPTALILFPLLVFFAARTWRARAVLTAATIAIIAPVTIANWRTSHAFIPVQAFGGLNFYIGNSPLLGNAPTRPGGTWERIDPEAARHGSATPLDDDRYYLRKTRAEIAEHPLSFAALLLRKFVRTFQNDEIRDTHSFYFFPQFAPLLWLVPFAVLLGFAAGGATVADWRQRATWLPAGYVAAMAVTTTALIVAARYRMPIVVGLAPFAGLGLDALLQRDRRLRTGLTAAVAAALSLVWTDAATHNVAEEWALTAESLVHEHNASDAEVAARKAIALDPKLALGYDALGTALDSEGRTSEGIAALRNAVALNPDYATAHLHLGELEEKAGDAGAAVPEYERAIAVNPRDSRALRRLANAEVQRGHVARATWALTTLAARDPSPDTLFGLARLQGASGNAKGGLATARRAMSMRDPTTEEWLLVATLAIDAGDFAAAQQAIDRAQGANAPPIAIVWTTALLRYREGNLQEAEQLLEQLPPDFAEAQQLRAAISRARTTATSRPQGSAAVPAKPSTAPR